MTVKEQIDRLEDYTEYIYNNELKHYGFIYTIEDTLNNKFYIGQKKIDNKSRWKSYMGSGYHLKNAQNKYGIENFTRKIISYADSLEELNNLEYVTINDFNAVSSNQFYNKVDGGNIMETHIKKISIPVICVNNGYVFKSKTDASTWAKIGAKTLDDRLYGAIPLTNNTKLMFRPLKCVEYGHKLCCYCAKNFKAKTNNIKHCEKCSSRHKNFIKELKKNNKNIKDLYSKTVNCFTLTDKWVKEKREEYYYEIRNTKSIFTALNTKTAYFLRDFILDMNNKNYTTKQIKDRLDLKCHNAAIERIIKEYGVD